MTTTHFQDGKTPIMAEWLNEVNDHVHTDTPVSTRTYVHDSSALGYTPAGTGAVATDVQSKLREVVSVKDFGAVGDGSTDDYAAILAACTAAVAEAKEVYFPAGTYLVKSPLSFNSSFSSLKWRGTGVYSSIIKKGFDGDLVTLTNCVAFESHNMHYQGQYGTYTGKCFVVKGTSAYPVWMNNMTEAFSDLHIEFQSNAGFSANIIGHISRIAVGQPTSTVIGLTSNDTGYTVRKIIGCEFAGNIDVSGCNDFYISDSQFVNLLSSSTTFNAFVTSCRFGTGGATTTFYGTVKVSNCSFSGSIVLDASFQGTFLGNQQSGGTHPYYTNNSFTNSIIHKPPNNNSPLYINRHSLSIGTASEIQINAISSIGDVDFTWVPDASVNTLCFAANLTADRTFTLPTTNVRNGMVVRITRPGGSTGGPWVLIIGTTGKSLANATWCDVIYNGSAWVVSAYGTLI